VILIEHFSQAMANLYYSKLRSFLAVLGIMVGTASVVALVTSGELATRKALEQFKSLGTDLLAISVYSTKSSSHPSPANSISAKEWQQLRQEVPNVEIVAPYTTVYEPISFQGRAIRATIVAADASLKDVIKIQTEQGNFVSYLDTYEKYCYIGQDIAKKIREYTIASPVGQQLFIGKSVYTIIGVAKHWMENSFFNSDVNKSIFIPLRGVNMINANATINNAILRLKPKTNIDSENDAIRLFITRHAPELSFFPRSAKQIIKSMESQGKIFTLLLGLIGGISLLVGGIGVMNVMLVSVMERKREIGIRKAIGAHKKDIRLLFLIESMVLALFGGLLGVLLGLLASYIICLFTHWQFVFFLQPPLVGFLVSAVTGIFFGVYPAFRASNLDPIQTLRVD
jgi:putative ABC transport system permease protein